MTIDRISQIEEAALNAWPAPRQIVYDGWLLRFTGGPSKRVNSANVLYPSRLPFPQKIAYCEAVYDQAELPPLFRVPAPFSTPDLAKSLLAAGYHSFDETYVLTRELAPADPLPESLRVESSTVDDWIPFKGLISDAQPGPLALQQQILNCIVPLKTLIVLFSGAQPVACGMGVLEGDLLGFFSIYTHHDARRKGYARVVMSALTDWGLQGCAKLGYLQVEGFNQPARALYQQLGFELCYPYEYYKKD
ncbi:MAG: GNAT family N-acetyltransferase [Anaerolineaceae bacterium]|nr:GNAT family N-acetyltransferase [Anaerolineaceae bacterium]